MKIKKKMWYSLLSVLWIFILVFPVMASEIPEERQKPLLVDEAGLLTEEESSELLNKLEDISQRYENEVGIVTVNSLEGKTATTEILPHTGAALKDPGSSSSAVSSPTMAQEPPRGSSFTE